MSQTNDTRGSMSNMERPKEEASACGPACGCRAGATSGRARLAVGMIVLAVAAVLVVRAVTKSDNTASSQASESGFMAPQGAVAAPTVGTASVSSSPGESPVAAVASTAPAVADSPVASADAVADPPEIKAVVCGDLIQSLGDLNTRAMDLGGVFVFLPGEDIVKARAVVTVVEKAAETIRGRDITMGLFTIADGSPEYANLATQVPPPGVIAMVKGRGASAVSGDITESKLMQAFVAASSGGGCGPASSGCGPAGCK